MCFVGFVAGSVESGEVQLAAVDANAEVGVLVELRFEPKVDGRGVGFKLRLRDDVATDANTLENKQEMLHLAVLHRNQSWF